MVRHCFCRAGGSSGGWKDALILVLLAIVIGIGAFFYMIKSESQIETAEEKVCKGSIMNAYWDKQTPLHSAFCLRGV
jgi:hypothetical protein